jgi:type II secretory pathway component PulC
MCSNFYVEVYEIDCYLRPVFFLNLVLALSIVLILSLLMSVLSRINLLSKQMEIIENDVTQAEEALAELKSRYDKEGYIP